MGTPEFSAISLEKIITGGHEVVGVYTQPPRRAGRGKNLQKSYVHLVAEKHGLEVFTPINFKQQAEVAQFKSLNADVAIVVAYGLLLPVSILNAPKFGCLNLHGSLLPRWRGAAPIQRAIMAGDEKTGVMVMQMDKGLDTGAVALSKEIIIDKNTTALSLHDEMKEIGANLLLKALDKLSQGELEFTSQDETGVTYAKKIEKSEAKIDFSLSAKDVLNNIHGLSPFPGAWFEIELNGKLTRVKILAAKLVEAKGRVGEIIDEHLSIACAINAIQPTRLQKQGKGIVDLADFLRGAGELKGRIIS